MIEGWPDLLAGAPPVLPIVPAPLNAPRRTEPLVRAVPLAERTARALAGGAADEAVAIAVAALGVLVLRYIGQTDVLVRLLGDRPAVARLRLGGGPTAERTRRIAAEAIGEAARLPPLGDAELLRIVPREPGAAACHAAVAMHAPGRGRPGRGELRCADLALVLRPVRERLRAALIVNAARHDPSAADRLAAHLGRVMNALTTPPPGVRMDRLPLLDDAERAQVMLGWNDTAEPVPGPHLPDLVAATARERPAAVAVVHGTRRIRYGALDADADRLAQHLLSLGVRPGDVVGVWMPRCPEHIVAQLAVWRTGATVLLLDPQRDAGRLAYLLADSPLAALLTVTAAGPRPGAVLADRTVVLDADPAWRRAPARSPGHRLRDTDVCHIAYTAGSAGSPKAVLMRHGSLRNTVHVLRSECAITGEARGTWLSAPSLSLIQADVLPLLAAGAAVHIPSADAAGSVTALREWLLLAGITHVLVGRERAKALWSMSWPPNCALRSMRVIGGQVPAWPPPGLPFSVLNVYGSAETNVVATCDLTTTAAALGDAVRAQRRPPIGRPVANSRAYVLGEDGEPVPPGVLGELHVSGAGLARGYLGQPDATAARFRANPFPEDPYAVLYRTGDLARYWPSGVIEVVGRLAGPRAGAVRRADGDLLGGTVIRRIAALYGAVLGTGPVGERADFFALGGDDERAGRLLRALYDELGTTMTIAELRAAPTVAAVAYRVVRAWLGGTPPTIVPDAGALRSPFPLTPAQRRLWLAAGGRAGPLDLYEWPMERPDPGRLDRAWRTVTVRHAALRTTVGEDGRQVVSEGPRPLETVDLSALDPAEARARAAAGPARLRSTGEAPRLRLTLLPGGTAVAALLVPPLLADDDSVHRVLLPELAAAWHGRPLPPPPAITFRDYARDSLTRWAQHELDSAAPAEPRVRGGEPRPLRRELPPDVVARLRARCAEAATGLPDALVATLHDLLAETDLSWLTPGPHTLVQRTAHRVPADPAVGGLVGCFSVWRRIRLAEGNPTFAERSRAVAHCPTEAAPLRCAVQVSVPVDRPGPVTAATILSRGPLADADLRLVPDRDALRMHWSFPADADPAAAAALADAYAARLVRHAEDEAVWWEGVDAFNKAHGT